jgi:hypothetical protein
MGNCNCCCPLNEETLPDWQLEGYKVVIPELFQDFLYEETNGWYQSIYDTKSCCWYRSFEVIGNYNTRLEITEDLIRSAVVASSRVDAMGWSDVGTILYKCLDGPATSLPPFDLCPIPVGSVGSKTCETNAESKIRGLFYYQPYRIEMLLSNHKEVCFEEDELPKNIYTLRTIIRFRCYTNTQRFDRNCTRINYYSNHECLEVNRSNYVSPDCNNTTNLDYSNPIPPEDIIWPESNFSYIFPFYHLAFSVVVDQFEEIPKEITINSHTSPISKEKFEECIRPSRTCQQFEPTEGIRGLGLIEDEECYTFNSFWTFNSAINDPTSYLVIVPSTVQDLAAYVGWPLGNPPQAGFPNTIWCPEFPGGTTFISFPVDISNPFCSLTLNVFRGATNSPENSYATCGFATGFFALGFEKIDVGELWLRFKSDIPNSIGCRLVDPVPCPPDGDWYDPEDPPIPVEPGDPPWRPDGYECGWYGGDRYLTIRGIGATSHEQDSEWLPHTDRTVCIDPFDFNFDIPDE